MKIARSRKEDVRLRSATWCIMGCARTGTCVVCLIVTRANHGRQLTDVRAARFEENDEG